MLLSTGFKYGEFGGHSCSGINSRVSVGNNSMLACAQWTFQVSQGSVETLFRWGGKHLHPFAANVHCIQETIYQAFEFRRRYFKKHFGLFFSVVRWQFPGQMHLSLDAGDVVILSSDLLTFMGMVFCIRVSNVKLLASTVPEIRRGSRNSKK